jgi:putative transcriptional regulator
MEYSAHEQYSSYMINTLQQRGPMIEISIEQLLEARSRTFYWLAKETGISHTTLWRLKKDKALGINFATLEKLCEALDCQPGDLFTFTDQKKQRARNSLRTHATRGSASR